MKLILHYSIFFIILFLFLGCSDELTENKQVNIVFRFDDPSALSSTEIELKVINIFREHNASLTFGVIPYKCAGSTRDTSPQDIVPLGSKKGDLLKKAVDEGIVDIALHGYSHQMRDTKIWTEFTGLDYASQLEKLSKGKKLLEKMIGSEVFTFIPPYNTYDLNTLRVLEVLNFSTISAGIRMGASNNSKLNFMPMTIRLHQIHDAVIRARASLDKQPLIVVMFHEYDFINTDIKGIDKRTITFEELNEHLNWLESQKDIRFLSISQANKVIQDLSPKRLRMVNTYSFFKSIIPGFFKESLSVYPESLSLLNVLVKTTFLYLFFLIFSIVFSYYILCFISQKSVSTIKLITFGNIILTVAFILYVTHDFVVHFKGMSIITILVGGSIGSWICFTRNRKD